MSTTRSQALIAAPPSRVWELLGDPRRHPEWWPRVIEVRGEQFDEGSNYAQITDGFTGRHETTMTVDELDDLREIHMSCAQTGTYARWLLTEARGHTFVDVEFGMNPKGLGNRIFDATIGKVYFRRWLEQSVASLEQAAASPPSGEAGVASR